ncbi:hypothetical protein BDW59DRAFT_166440 [Aspergillus cavernicola]|uniref:Zn(2)-C6 fungal-type domain-containing protein n=1 Tax=Aspergillus cavernicola TaxID=176166 RepID=A0ABR4HL81_9EURO
MACDNCRRRKVQCNREQPCPKCQEASLNCAYTSVPQRKGPKGNSARVLSSLRSTGGEEHSSIAPANYTPSSFPAPPTLHSMQEVNTTSPVPSVSFPHTSSSSDGRSELLFLPSYTYETRRLPASILMSASFMQNLYPIMPVIDPKSLCDSTDPESLHPHRYAYLAALSAATHL